MSEASASAALRPLLTTDAVGGIWTYALDLAAGLAARGAEPILAVLGPAPAPGLREAAAGLQIVQTGLPLDWMARGQAELTHMSASLARLARRVDADLVHLSMPVLAADGAFGVPVLGVAHSCLETWRQTITPHDPQPAWAWRRAALARGYAACDALLAPSHAFAELTWAAYGRRPIVVHNGRAAPPTQPGARRTARVVTAGRLWDAAKDLATLDTAAAMIDAPVLALGEGVGPHGEHVALRHVSGLGRVDPLTLRAILARSAIFASCARYEPFGLSVLEAAQAGCALLLSDIPTFRELWSGAATFVPPGDSAAFADAARLLLDDAPRRRRLAAAARARAARYGLDAFVEGTVAAHRAVLQRERRAVCPAAGEVAPA